MDSAVHFHGVLGCANAKLLDATLQTKNRLLYSLVCVWFQEKQYNHES